MKGTKTPFYRILFAVTALFITTCVASAQQQPKPSAQSSPPADYDTQALNNFATGLSAFSGGGVVKGAPFSAVGIVEITQILSDGSRSERRREESIYRDNEGSTRLEMKVNKVNAKTTAVPAIIAIPRIYDAVTGASYFFDPRNHTALLFPPHFVLGSLPRQSKIITTQSPPDDITRIAGEKVERLGTQLIEGLKVEGVRATTTIPASQMRNNQPGEVVYERWYSQELRVNVLIKCSDPRFGEGAFRLTNIDRSEPAHELFVVPPDYKVTELKFGPSKGSELNKPLNLKFERGDRIAVENRTTGRIR
ncbi:MAG: hypothetical protein M3362_18375, partial [Acidobacteriota bacterium]|nr:hypothetical protein [Acidobacteriota bacterium]